MIRLFDRLFGGRGRHTQRGITGTEAAIVIAAGAAVVVTMAVALYASVGGSGDTVYAELQEASGGLEPRGGVVGFTGALPDGATAVYKVGFVVAGAPDSDPVDLAGNSAVDGAGTDPDDANGTSGISVRYISGGEVVEGVPWTVAFLGYSDGDALLEPDEKAQFSVWLYDRDNAIDIASPGAIVPRADGTGPAAPLEAGQEFRVEVETQPGSALRISRVVPDELTPVVDMR